MSAARFGTFGGVFTPNVLTILGVIMFLRLGQVVGQSGIWYALLIIACAKLITSLTAMSLAAIATNTRVQGGGAYFMISRSLGVEYGGAIGIVFYLAQAVSVAMYIIGFTEALLSAFPQAPLSFRAIATLVNAAVFACVFVGAGWTIRMQYAILAVLVLSLASFFAGALPAFSLQSLAANASPQFLAGSGFFVMFALFFPAATGIMAGANMSGDLQDPARSIPTGTFAAIAVTGLVYVALALVLAGSAPRDALIGNNLLMGELAWMPALILAGVFAATLSSALGSMMGAPRILQALARDGIFPRLRGFAKGSGKSDEPRRATVLTFAIAQAGVMLGELDLIAPIITMFFMITYGTLNLACFYEGFSRNPSFRPRFRYTHWSMSLAGALGCVAVMLLMEPLWAVVSVAAMAGLHGFVARKEVHARWGDVASGFAYERARKALLRLEEERYHPKNWRPGILALSTGVWDKHHVAEYGYWLSAGRGLLTLGQVIGGEVDDQLQARRDAEQGLRRFIREQELQAFGAVVVERDLLEGVSALLQAHGIGGLRPNTLLLGWSDDARRVEEFAHIYRLASALRMSVVVVKGGESLPPWTVPDGPVDVWWRGRHNGALMLILAHLLVQNPEFRHRPVRVLHVAADETARAQAVETLSATVAQARIDATVEVIVSDDPAAQMCRRSRDSATVFIGFDPPEEGKGEFFADTYETVLEACHEVVLVHSSGDVDLEA